jgi:hypothetical protein
MTGWNYSPQPPQGPPRTIFDDIEAIKGMVARYFPIYNTEVHFDTVSLYCHVEKASLEPSFESLRRDLRDMAYIPLITEDRGNTIIHVVKRPPEKFWGVWLNAILLVATIGTTVFAGASIWDAVFDAGGVFSAESLYNGALYFALPLMLILGIHEFGHYIAARMHGVAASMPFFIPAPTMLGTLGALISIREPIPSKKALLDIGIAGPIAGFVVAIPVLCIGLFLSGEMGAPAQDGALPGGTMLVGSSMLFQGFVELFGLGGGVSLHPTAFAGWVGFLVTALNLLPVGQLDGGHIARALLGERSRWAGYAALGTMLVLGLFYSGWLFFALIIMFMGLRHPPPLNDVTLLTTGRKAVGIAAAAMLVLCFVPVPFSTVPVNHDFTFQEADGTEVGPYFSHSMAKPLSPGWQNVTFDFRMENTGNMPLELDLYVHADSGTAEPAFVEAWFSETGNPNSTASDHFSASLGIGESANLTLHIMVGPVFSPASVTAEVQELGYEWTSRNLMTDSPTAHGMRVRVDFG